MATSVIMPQLGESVVDGTILKWLKMEGEQVNEFDPLLEVETVKVTSEIPSPATGVLLKILVPEGQTVLARTVLAWIGQPGEIVPDGGELPQETEEAIGEKSPGEKPTIKSGRKDDLGFISPVVARIARENQLDLSLVKGSGSLGLITK
jgi:2-oxoglutarate dehydrogenase E2 component (dihydrolipoamide succinyltransferase)